MAQLTRQDVQTVIEGARKRIIDRMVTKQDLQTISQSISDNSRDRIMNYTHDLIQAQQQQLLRRTAIQNDELQRRIIDLDSRLTAIDQDMRQIRSLLERIASQENQNVFMPAQQQADTDTEHPYTRYVFRPS